MRKYHQASIVIKYIQNFVVNIKSIIIWHYWDPWARKTLAAEPGMVSLSNICISRAALVNFKCYCSKVEVSWCNHKQMDQTCSHNSKCITHKKHTVYYNCLCSQTSQLTQEARIRWHGFPWLRLWSLQCCSLKNNELWIVKTWCIPEWIAPTVKLDE